MSNLFSKAQQKTHWKDQWKKMSKKDRENVLVQALIETTTKIYNDKKENVENETQNESQKNNSEKQKTKNNLIKILDTFKDCNFDINRKNNGGINPFMIVCLHAPEYIPLFIEYGADPFVELKDTALPCSILGMSSRSRCPIL